MKTILMSCLLLLMVVTISAQPRGREIQERLESQRVAFITEKLELTPEESAKFWPLYNEYKEKHQKLRQSAVHERLDQRMSSKGLSNEEAQQVIDSQFSFEQDQLDLKKEYYARFKSAISLQKLAQLGPAEMEFNRTVLERVRDKMQERRN